jgi:hypothetical protein
LCEEHPEDHVIVEEEWEYMITAQSRQTSKQNAAGYFEPDGGWSEANVLWLFGGDIAFLNIMPQGWAPESGTVGISARWFDSNHQLIGIAVRLRENVQVTPAQILTVMHQCIDAGFYGSGFYNHNLKQTGLLEINDLNSFI